ncbi:MAG: DUF547 domain-containing protein, partial [bacterium]
PWDYFLRKYVVTDHPSGVNRFRYGDVSETDRKLLDSYIQYLAHQNPRKLNRKVQKAYWLNLYNALTVRLVIENYPVASIKDIGDSGASAGTGPWDKKLVRVAGKKLSLNDIEHRILRPIWRDHRIHFGLINTSIGGPEPIPAAFTAANTKSQLVEAGKRYINHPRAVTVDTGQMKLSSLFKWYERDFGKDPKTMKKVLAHYAQDKTALYLLGYHGEIDYAYDWRLNAP